MSLDSDLGEQFDDGQPIPREADRRQAEWLLAEGAGDGRIAKYLELICQLRQTQSRQVAFQSRQIVVQN